MSSGSHRQHLREKLKRCPCSRRSRNSARNIHSPFQSEAKELIILMGQDGNEGTKLQDYTSGNEWGTWRLGNLLRLKNISHSAPWVYSFLKSGARGDLESISDFFLASQESVLLLAENSSMYSLACRNKTYSHDSRRNNAPS